MPTHHRRHSHLNQPYRMLGYAWKRLRFRYRAPHAHRREFKQISGLSQYGEARISAVEANHLARSSLRMGVRIQQMGSLCDKSNRGGSRPQPVQRTRSTGSYSTADSYRNYRSLPSLDFITRRVYFAKDFPNTDLRREGTLLLKVGTPLLMKGAYCHRNSSEAFWCLHPELGDFTSPGRVMKPVRWLRYCPLLKT